MATSLDRTATAVARQLAELAGNHKSGVVQSSRWTERMLEWAMSHPSFKTQLFRFVDVFPATTSDADVMRHLDEYFEGADVPKVLDLGLDVADHVPFGKAAAATIARRNITRVAEQFIVGTGPGRRGGRPAPAVAAGAAPSPSTSWARRRSPTPRPTATRPGSAELLAALLAETPPLGARRPPRVRRPRAACRG